MSRRGAATSSFELRNVVVERAGRTVLRDVSATLPAGSVAVFGPSGAGKSTLLRLLNRLLEPSRGAVLYAGRNVRELDPRALRRRVALVPQLPALEPTTVAENLLLGLRFADADGRLARRRWASLRELVPALRARRRPGVRARAATTGAAAQTNGAPAALLERLLESVGLDPAYLWRSAEQLSVGQQQRVMIARALALEPEVLLLDEPTAALDAEARNLVEETLVRLRAERGIALVLVSHDRAQVERLCDWVVALADGAVVAEGPVGTVLSSSA